MNFLSSYSHLSKDQGEPLASLTGLKSSLIDAQAGKYAPKGECSWCGF